MSRQRFYAQQVREGMALFDEAERHHITKVLRLGAGSAVEFTDGLGGLYRGKLELGKKDCTASEVETIRQAPLVSPKCRLRISPTKNSDRMEWMVEKATEIGIDQIDFILCSRTERNRINRDRLLKKAVSAMKQSGRLRLPVLSELRPFSELLNTVKEHNCYIGHLEDQQTQHLFKVLKPASEWIIFVGPEGDFTREEIAQSAVLGVQSVTLGENILRTETAGLVAAHLMQLKKQVLK